MTRPRCFDVKVSILISGVPAPDDQRAMGQVASQVNIPLLMLPCARVEMEATERQVILDSDGRMCGVAPAAVNGESHGERA